MINDSMKTTRLIGMVQPKKYRRILSQLYDIGCLGKITVLVKQKMEDI